MIPRNFQTLLLPRNHLLHPSSALRHHLQPQHLQVHYQQTRTQANIFKKLFKRWTGSGDAEHAIHRSERHDTTDPETQASSEGMADRKTNEGIAEQSMSQATTERGGLRSERKAKKEHPKAPEPIVGMNDERVQKEG